MTAPGLMLLDHTTQTGLAYRTAERGIVTVIVGNFAAAKRVRHPLNMATRWRAESGETFNRTDPDGAVRSPG